MRNKTKPQVILYFVCETKRGKSSLFCYADGKEIYKLLEACGLFITQFFNLVFYGFLSLFFSLSHTQFGKVCFDAFSLPFLLLMSQNMLVLNVLRTTETLWEHLTLPQNVNADMPRGLNAH